MVFIQLIPDVFIGSFVIWIITANIMELMALVKCFGRKKCRHPNCPLRFFCYRKPDLSLEEYDWLFDELQRMIDDMRKELDNCNPH